MSFRSKPFMLSAFALVLSVVPAVAQTAFVQGTVKGPDGKIIEGAVVAFDRIDINSHVEAKTDKKGHYVTSMKPTNYNVTVTVDGKVRDKVNNYLAIGGSGDALNFDLKEAAGGPAAPATLTSAPAAKGDAAKGDDKAAKEREAQLAKNKELNDSFSAGSTAIDNKQWDEAITQLSRASEIGPTQKAVWARLAEAYVGSAKAAKGADQAPIYDKAFAAFDKLLTLAPDDAGNFNTYALALAADKKLDDAKVKLAKAVELDPSGAGKYHYNLGALLMNSSQTDGALDEFKKSIEADPNYAEAYYYLGATLVGKATLDASGTKMVAPAGTTEALQKYLSLKPDGPNASSAKDLLTALGTSVQANYKDPNAPAPKAPAKKGK